MGKQPTAGIVLAAGMSTRMGITKQLMDLEGKCLLAWVIDAALQSELELVVLVLGHDAELIQKALGARIQEKRLVTVVNHRYQDGMSLSLQEGLLQVKDRFPSVMFLLGDQPLIEPETINHILQCFHKSDREICLPVYCGRSGNPVCFGRRFYNAILDIRGDQGAREIVRRYPRDVLEVVIDTELPFLDVDNRADQARILSHLRDMT